MNDELNDLPKKELLDRAKALGVAGSASLRKDDLVKAIRTAMRKQERAKAKPAAVPKPALAPKPAAAKPAAAAKNVPPPSVNGHAPKPLVIPPARSPARSSGGTKPPVGRAAPKSPEVPVRAARCRPATCRPRSRKDLPAGYGKDRIVVMVRDPYWLHAYWELTRHAIQRAEAALGQEWHTAKPILRLLDVSSHDTTSTSESVVRDIDIHGGCNNWYIDVSNPPRSYRVDIGYLSPQRPVLRPGPLQRRHHAAGRRQRRASTRTGPTSTPRRPTASTPCPAASTRPPAASELKQLFEERLRRPLGSPAVTSFGSGGLIARRQDRKFWFQLDAELIVYGATEPNARVTLQGEPVKLRPDGTFTMRFSLPDSRQIIPAVATSPDGIEERTIVLAVERNTKQLEPMIHDGNED